MTRFVSKRPGGPRRTNWVLAAAVGLCGVGLMSAIRAGDEPNTPLKASAPPRAGDRPVEAPTGFDQRTNGYEDQDAYNDDLKTFSEIEDIEHNGLGPVYNATSCVECHRNPVPGGSSQIVEIRTGRHVVDPNDPSPRKVRFEEPSGGSVIQQRAVDPSIQETVPPEDDVRTFRLSNSVLGNGFIEVIPDDEILRIRDAQQQFGMQGFAVVVPAVVEAKRDADNQISFTYVERIGRFGWKCQEASLLNFSAGAYITEMGITNPLQPTELTSNGRDVSKFDRVKDPEDKDFDEDDPKRPRLYGNDVEAFTRFMRCTKAPARKTEFADGEKGDVIAGERLFRDNKRLGCAVCHHPDYTTPKAGTPIVTLGTSRAADPYTAAPGSSRGSDMGTVPDALGNKIIHPFSDFLLHDIGTGDGIAQTQHADLPSRGQRHARRIPDKLRKDEEIGRVTEGDEKDGRRTLKPDPDVDQRTTNKIRTAPLWGLRTRPQLMHDGLSLTIEDAILRHHGQAEGVRLKYEALSGREKKQLLAFLGSL